MKIVAKYSFNGGEKIVNKKYPQLYNEISSIIQHINASECKTKTSKEKTMPGKKLYSPVELNKKLKTGFKKHNWNTIRIKCDYPTNFYLPGYKPPGLNSGAFREMDFIKEKLGVEIQFGKYAFMVYNVCAKMTIFKKSGYIDTGVEIVGVKNLTDKMSTGVSYFEQFAWDLEKRGISNIDIPVLILGIDV